MFSFFRKYHYVPPCPRCGSLRTGRICYINNTAFGVEKLIAENLKYGELSKVELGFGGELDYNAFCEDCGIRWMANIEELKLTQERIEKECKDRNISHEMYTNMRDIKKITRLEKKKQKQEERKLRKKEKQKQKPTKKNTKSKITKSPNKKNNNQTPH